MRSWLIAVVILCGAVGGVVQAESHSWLFVSLINDKQIVTYERDANTGALQRRDVTQCSGEPAIMCVSPDRKTLFAALRSSGQLASFRIDVATGGLRQVSIVAGGDDPAYLLVDRSGGYLLSAYYVANKVMVHALGPDGSISKEPTQSIPTAEKAHGIALDSSNQLAFVTHTGANRIFQFRFDPKNGRLSPADESFTVAADGQHPRHIHLHPSDRWAYVNNEAGDSLSVFGVNRSACALKHIQTLSTLPDGDAGSRNATARCEMTTDGRFVYVANRGHDSIAGFAVDQETGRISSLGQWQTEKTPRSFTIDSSGRFLYVAGQGSGRIAMYRIGERGGLTRAESYDVGPVPWCVLAVETMRE